MKTNATCCAARYKNDLLGGHSYEFPDDVEVSEMMNKNSRDSDFDVIPFENSTPNHVRFLKENKVPVKLIR